MNRVLRRLLTAFAVVCLVIVGFGAMHDVGEGARFEAKHGPR